MFQLLEEYADIILTWKITRYEQYGSSFRLRVEVEFKDGSKLFIRETILEGGERKYAYHWQGKEQKLLIRLG